MLVDFEFAAHAADQNVQGLVHFFDGLEFTAFDLF
jgi:hypothetical protein